MIQRGSRTRAPRTPWILGVFFVFSTVACALAGLSLLAPGSALDGLWQWKAEEHRQLLALGPAVGAGFLLLAAIMSAASYGAFTRRRWGLRLACFIFAANALGDAARLATGAIWEGLIGIAAAGLILFWLTRPQVRRAFK